jgi:hypothetical protein
MLCANIPSISQARDFDGDSLRHTLPRAVRALHEALSEPNAK